MKSMSFSSLGKQIIPLILVFTVASIFLFSCQKTEKIDMDSSEIAEAKSWFISTVLTGESRMLAKPFSELPETSPLRVLARMNKLSKKLDWSKAITGSADQLEYVLVPLQKDELKLKDNYFIKRAFVFYKYNSAPMQMQVVELLTKNQPAANPVQLAATLFERKVAAKGLPVQIQDVKMFFYDIKYNTLDAYEIKSNKWEVLKASCLNKPADNQTMDSDGAQGDCVEWGVFWVTYDDNGNIIDSQLLYTYWVGNCPANGDDPNESSDPNGGGGGAGGGGDWEDGNEAYRTLGWHVYNTSGGPLSPTAPGTGVNSMENVRGRKIPSHPNGGYFKSASHYTSTCNSCDDGTGGTYWETSATVTYTPDQVSSTVTGRYPKDGASFTVGGSKSWTFNQVF